MDKDKRYDLMTDILKLMTKCISTTPLSDEERTIFLQLGEVLQALVKGLK